MRFLLGLCLLLFLSTSTDRTISIRITNIDAAKGCVRVAMFASAADFENDENAVFGKVIPLSSRADLSLEVPIRDGGTYGIALFHDINDNGKLDRTLVGIPKEPYAFSNNPKAKWEKPSFADISFQPRQATSGPLELRLASWSDR